MTATMPRPNRRIALTLGCCLATLGWAGMAQAQAQAADAADEDASEIIVTGSRVRGEAPVGSTVIALGRAEIEASSDGKNLVNVSAVRTLRRKAARCVNRASTNAARSAVNTTSGVKKRELAITVRESR